MRVGGIGKQETRKYFMRDNFQIGPWARESKVSANLISGITHSSLVGTFEDYYEEEVTIWFLGILQGYIN